MDFQFIELYEVIGMDVYLLIQNNELWIWKNVHAFSQNQGGYGSIRYDEDDLYQECVTYLIGKYRRSGLTAREFKVSALDLRHVMCEYMQSLLPVKVPKTPRNYTKVMREYNSQDTDDVHGVPLINHPCDGDCICRVDLERFNGTLDENDRLIFGMVCKGLSWSEIIEQTGLTKSSVYRSKRRIAKAYERYAL